MARSGVKGFDRFKEQLRRVADAADFEMAEANRENARTLQRHVVPRVPVRTGETKAAFAAPEAVGLSRKYRGGWRFGLITKELRKKGWKAHFLEFGTKGYRKGDSRTYEARLSELRPTFTKGGKRVGRPAKQSRTETRSRTVDRNIPARPAKPFFRPGIEAARIEIVGRWRGAVRRAVELKGQRISIRQLEDA